MVNFSARRRQCQTAALNAFIRKIDKGPRNPLNLML